MAYTSKQRAINCKIRWAKYPGKPKPKCHPENPHYAFGMCRQCYSKYWTKHNRTKMRNYARRSNWKRKYGMSWEAYHDMLKDQGGRCLICNKKPSRKEYLCVDHNHETKEIRGLLCKACNVGIGSFRDDPDLLVAASLYLEDAYQ